MSSSRIRGVAPRRRTAAAGRVVAVATAVIAIVSFAVAGPVMAATAAKPVRITKSTACKVLTRTQIEAVLGGKATAGSKRRKGPDFQCNWSANANSAGRPAGTLEVDVSFDVPPGAYDALKDNPSFEHVTGFGESDALYRSVAGTLSVFKGNRILTLRGVFFDSTTRPIRTYDPRAELVELAKTADARL